MNGVCTTLQAVNSCIKTDVTIQSSSTCLASLLPLRLDLLFLEIPSVNVDQLSPRFFSTNAAMLVSGMSCNHVGFQFGCLKEMAGNSHQ